MACCVDDFHFIEEMFSNPIGKTWPAKSCAHPHEQKTQPHHPRLRWLPAHPIGTKTSYRSKQKNLRSTQISGEAFSLEASFLVACCTFEGTKMVTFLNQNMATSFDRAKLTDLEAETLRALARVGFFATWNEYPANSMVIW